MEKLFAARLVRLTVSAVAAATLVAGAADAALGTAKDAVKDPKLKHGTLTVDGTSADDTIALRLAAGSPDTLQADIDGTVFSFARADVANIVVDAKAGDDAVRIDETNGVFTDAIPTILDGGAGDDTIAGGTGAETLLGGSGNDVVDGNRGNDQAQLGSGDDTFVWDPGDGSDAIEGDSGNDTMRFNGANVAEHVVLAASGSHLLFTRDIANITMDTDGVEQVDFNALGGADTVDVGDLAATDVTNVDVDLAATGGGGDNAADHVNVNGTPRDDTIDATGNPTGVDVTGLAATVSVMGAEAADQVAVDGAGGANHVNVDGTDGNDTIGLSGDATTALVTAFPPTIAVRHDGTDDELAVNGLGGDDTISANGLTALGVGLTLDGGAGNDVIGGSQGAETLLGGDGDDVIDGNRGNDQAELGAGADTFVWDPGDGSDTIEGDAGNDTMRFNGANVAEKVDLSADGTHLRFTRDVASITMDTDGVEEVDFNALGGADAIAVNDLAATDVNQVELNLAATGGGGDGAADQVKVEATNDADNVTVTGSAAAGVHVTGLAAAVDITGSEAANDALRVDALDGDDVVAASGLAGDALALTADGGNGADVLIGSAGDDTLLGGEGDDVLEGGPGQDVLDGGPGSNVLIQD
jgi:Ca2+-binding RTX toxin-like protein